MSNSNKEADAEVIIDAAKRLGQFPNDLTDDAAREEILQGERRQVKRARRLWERELGRRKH